VSKRNTAEEGRFLGGVHVLLELDLLFNFIPRDITPILSLMLFAADAAALPAAAKDVTTPSPGKRRLDDLR
jgi:hypothetical protein